jgi:hypothetical protein
MAQHQFGGALLGEHLGQLLAIGWSVTVSALVLRTGMLPRWVGWTGLVASTLWGLWMLALGVAVLRRPAPQPATGPTGDSALGPTA